MRVHSIIDNRKNISQPTFGALKIAKIKTLGVKQEDVFIYSLEKDKDDNFCANLLNNLLKSDVNRMQINASSIRHFLKNAIYSYTYADESVVAVKGDKPFGFLSTITSNSDKDVHLAYITTWKTQELQKVQNGGSMLIDYLFNKFQNKRQIDLTPAYNSDTFYYKFGFDYEDEYEMNRMSICERDIKEQIEKLSKRFSYNSIENEQSIDLVDKVNY